ncbi:outer membrane protein assembly factor BamD [bacterium]|nr:outer membrane protein assembly factor BamD [bacterium]NUN46430.1 outer membrane protein assembly factor BamD [bacterium]
MLRKIFVLAMACSFLLSTGCSKKDVTQYMTSREHFEYAMKFFNKKNWTSAQEQFSLITYKYSGSDIADDAQFYLAESYYRQKDWVSASSEFERMVSSYPKSEFIEKSMYQLALCYIELSPGFALDQKFTYQAQNAIQNFIDLFPRSELRTEMDKHYKSVKDKLARKHFESAQIYRKISEFEAAIVYYDQVITDYYDSPYAMQAKYWKGYCNYKIEEFQKAQILLKKFIDEYPLEKEWVTDALETLEDIKKDELKAQAKAAKEAKLVKPEESTSVKSAN